jgi:RNA recognition motif-containing protein
MNKLFVGNLPYSLEEADLSELFESAGKVRSVKIPLDRESGRKRGFGFVEMADEESATTAIFLLNNRPVAGRNIFVSIAKPRAA